MSKSEMSQTCQKEDRVHTLCHLKYCGSSSTAQGVWGIAHQWGAAFCVRVVGVCVGPCLCAGCLLCDRIDHLSCRNRQANWLDWLADWQARQDTTLSVRGAARCATVCRSVPELEAIPRSEPLVA